MITRSDEMNEINCANDRHPKDCTAQNAGGVVASGAAGNPSLELGTLSPKDVLISSPR